MDRRTQRRDRSRDQPDEYLYGPPGDPKGLANYIIKQGGSGEGVAIAFDSRHMSPEFAMKPP